MSDAHPPETPAADADQGPTNENGRSETIQTALLAVLLVAAGLLSWRLALRPPLDVQAESLSTIPRTLEPWTGKDIPVEDTVERMLRADYHVQRAYVNPVGEVVWLYVGYYGTDRGGRSEHTPWQCYPSAGWAVLDGQTEIVEDVNGRGAYEIIVERGDTRRLVHFWYQSHRSTGLVRAVEHAVDRVVGRLFTGRGDGAFVRVSTPLGGPAGASSREAARAKLLAFGAEIDRELKARWPNEAPRES